jgi:peptide/nickel transport system permease protein
MKYLKKVVKRILISAISLFGIIVITFFISRALPGDPVWNRLPAKATPEDYIREKKRLGLNQPIFVQFFVYLQDLFTGNWGFSLVVAENYPIMDLINTYLPRTLDVTIISMFVAIVLGIKFGKIAAAHRNGKRDIIIRIFSYFFMSIPGFIVVLFLMQIFIYTPFRIFPPFGVKNMAYAEPPRVTFSRLLDCLISGKIYLFVDALWHLIVPVSAMAIIQMVSIFRYTRVSILDVLQMDHIRTAQAKGLKQKRILKKHAMKNALPPVITVSATGFPIVLGGMVAVEYLYNYPGLAFLFREAVVHTDYPLIIAIVFIFGICVIFVNLLADIINIFLDPRSGTKS